MSNKKTSRKGANETEEKEIPTKLASCGGDPALYVFLCQRYPAIPRQQVSYVRCHGKLVLLAYVMVRLLKEEHFLILVPDSV